MHISSQFDGGNIEVESAARPDDIRLKIRRDHQSDFMQWFCYRVAGARGQALTMRIVNAGEATYTQGWEGYAAVASHDMQTYHRVPTRYADGVLEIQHTPLSDCVTYSYFAPYNLVRHAALVAGAAADEETSLSVLGQTVDGRDIDLLTLGAPAAGKRAVWAIARQHPGETMAEWWMEGFLDRLINPADPLARALRQKAVFYVVPNMNPDGSFRGHLRTNAAGVNLNRAWAEPSPDTSPEVYYVREHMRRTGVDFCIDVHGDEAIPYNFIAGSHGIPSLKEKQIDLHDRFCAALVRANPDFQIEHGYPKAPPGRANMTMSTNHIAEAFDCLAMTLEMPFKDVADAPNQMTGWSPERSGVLGRACLDALAEVIDDLR